MTIKEYSTSRNITYEAARQAVEKAKPEIEKHIRKQGRTRYLLPEAVKILDDRRNKTKVSVVKKEITDKTDTIEKLKNEIIVLQKQLIEEKEKALESAEKVARIEALSSINTMQEAEIHRLQSELSRYERTIFGFYRKR